MLMIEKSKDGLQIKAVGDIGTLLAELGVLVETLDERVGGVYDALNNPIAKCLTRAYLKEMRGNGAKAKEPERKADGAESKE